MGGVRRESGGWAGFSWAGSGEPTVLLLDTWAGYGREWAATVRELCHKHRVVVVQADWNANPLTAETVAKDIAGVPRELRLGRVVVVGVGFDSFIARRVAQELGASAAGVIEVDPPLSLGTRSEERRVGRGVRCRGS